MPSSNIVSLPLPLSATEEIIVTPELFKFYFEERNTLALQNGTIITTDFKATRLNDIRQFISATPEILAGQFYGCLLPVKQVEQRLLDEYFQQLSINESENKQDSEVLTDVAKHLKRLQQKAVNLGSSDIHVELYESQTQFYARVDGRRISLEHTIPDHATGEALFAYVFTSKGKLTDWDFVAGKVNNGQIEQFLECPTEAGGTEQRLTIWRASYIPAKGGGKLTLRWLNANKVIPELTQMGLHDGHIEILKNFCFGNSGLCMIAGKTGSGKSTLIAALLRLFGKDKSVHTLEDPPEFDLGVIQTHVTPNTLVDGEERGYNFYSKVLLRHDGDVELHGEVRDHKGAMEVTRKGETGQIVFTTLHTSSAIGIGHTLTEQLHVPSAVVAAPDLMRLWAYQTLVRMLCPKCKMTEANARIFYDNNNDQNTFTQLLNQAKILLKDKHLEHVRYRNPHGCKSCSEGEKGRTALFEIIALDDEDRSYILRKDYIGWGKVLREKGFKDVRDHAIHKILNGLIDIDTAANKVSHLIPTSTPEVYARLDYEKPTLSALTEGEDAHFKTLE